MHFEILVEDQSGKITLQALIEKIIGLDKHSYRIHPYKGIGHIPKNLHKVASPQKRILLDRLPSLLRGYGKSLQYMNAAVIVIVDLDQRDCFSFKKELLDILELCNPQPTTLFRIAIEEGEAWLLGDINAVKAAYPEARNQALNSYEQDSICGTWEKLADAIYMGGAHRLKQLGWPYTGQAKCEWARNIAPHIDVESNKSPSFQVLRDGLRNLARVI